MANRTRTNFKRKVQIEVNFLWFLFEINFFPYFSYSSVFFFGGGIKKTATWIEANVQFTRRAQNTIRTITVDEVKHTDCYVLRDKHGYSKKKKTTTYTPNQTNVNGGWAKATVLNLRKTEQENTTGNYDLRVCDVASGCLVQAKQKIHKQNHRRRRRQRHRRWQSFYTHTQIFLLSLITFFGATNVYILAADTMEWDVHKWWETKKDSR